MNATQHLKRSIGWRKEYYVAPILGKIFENRLDKERADRLFTRNTCLIVQPMRSGGNLLVRLFDGHRNLNVRPYHLLFSRMSDKIPFHGWVNQKDLTKTCNTLVDIWRDVIYDPRFYYYKKGLPLRLETRSDGQSKTMYLEVDANIYYACLLYYIGKSNEIPSDLSVENVVSFALSGYFVAWKNYSLDGWRKHWNISHAPRHVTYEKTLNFFENFSRTMPNGRILTTVREPASWVSSLLHAGVRPWDFSKVVRHYACFADQLVDAMDIIAPEKLRIIPFESLILRTRETMDTLSDWLEIDREEKLYRPSINDLVENRRNTSFKNSPRSGIIDRNVLDRKEFLNSDQKELVDKNLTPMFEEILRKAEKKKIML